MPNKYRRRLTNANQRLEAASETGQSDKPKDGLKTDGSKCGQSSAVASLQVYPVIDFHCAYSTIIPDSDYRANLAVICNIVAHGIAVAPSGDLGSMLFRVEHRASALGRHSPRCHRRLEKNLLDEKKFMQKPTVSGFGFSRVRHTTHEAASIVPYADNGII